MPAKTQSITHLFAGGWATDLGESVDVTLDQNGKIQIPFLTRAENVFYELDGSPHKIGGVNKFVPTGGTPIESGAKVTGFHDYWKIGLTGTSVQKRVCHANTVLYDLDSEVNIATGFSLDAVPNYNQFDDKLIVSNDATGAADYPGIWDQSAWTLFTSGNNQPNFSFSVTHKNRVFAAGVASLPSELHYSVSESASDWSGAGSGTIKVNPGDGDEITGLASFLGELFIFKGPNKGSIHRLQGSAPTGTDPFRLVPFVSGVGAVWQNTIFKFANDLGFMWSDGSIYSLRSIEQFGDVRQASLSRGIDTWLFKHVVNSRLKFAWSAVDTQRGYVLIAVSTDSSTTNNEALMMDFRFGEPRWSRWPALAAASLGAMVDTASANDPIIVAGGNDGFTRRTQTNDNNIDVSTAINANVATPFLNYGVPFDYKRIDKISVNALPESNGDITFGWKRDQEAETTVTLTQGGTGDRLAPAVPTSENFILGQSTLSASSSRELFSDLVSGGTFRSIRYRIQQADLNRDMNVHSISALISSSSRNVEN